MTKNISLKEYHLLKIEEGGEKFKARYEVSATETARLISKPHIKLDSEKLKRLKLSYGG